MQKKTSFIFIAAVLFLAILACSTTTNVQPTELAATLALEATQPPAATATEAPPADTPVPTALPTEETIAGWTKFAGKGVVLWLPESYIGGDLSKDLDLIMSKLEALGSEYTQMVQTIKQNPDMYLLWCYDGNIGASGTLTNVNVAHEDVLSGITIAIYMDAVEKQLPSTFTIEESSTLQLKNYEAGKLKISVDVSGVSVKEVMYIVKVDTTIYLITYATSASEYATNEPIFEQSANTFRVTE
jgi:hypothetical protein